MILMADVSRELAVYADGKLIQYYQHARLKGKDILGLFPCSFMLEFWNLSYDQYLLLSRALKIVVKHRKSILASGDIVDIFRVPVEKGMKTQVCFSLGLSLWESAVSLSLESGKKVSETVVAILEETGLDISLIAFPSSDPVFARGQAFFGRAAESVLAALSAASFEVYQVESGISVVSVDELEVSLRLTESDLLSAPEFPSSDFAVVRTNVVGWSVGKLIQVTWLDERKRRKLLKGFVRERSVEADSQSGPWNAQLLLEVMNS